MVVRFLTDGSPLSLPWSLCAVGSGPHSTLETWPPVTKVGDKWGQRSKRSCAGGDRDLMGSLGEAQP